MLDVYRATELATSALHVIGGLSSAGAHIMQGDNGGAILVALTVAGCVLILTGAVALSEVVRVKVRRFVQKHERPDRPEPRNKGGLNA
jgi:hypothetical protein